MAKRWSWRQEKEKAWANDLAVDLTVLPVQADAAAMNWKGALPILIICSLSLCVVSCVNTHQTYHSKTMDKEEAISLASHLSYEMREEDAVAYLNKNGLTYIPGGGDSFGWNDFFSLSNRCGLRLGIRPKNGYSPGGAWTNGLVREICIYHRNGNIEPIAVSNLTVGAALKLIADNSSSSNEFSVAMKQLDSTKGDPVFWLNIAADDHYSFDRRRHFVRHFFEHFVTNGMSLSELAKSINAPVNWISYGKVVKMSPITAGWLPEAMFNKGTRCRFSVPILSEYGGEYRLKIEFALGQDLSLNNFNSILDGISITPTNNAVITGIAPWDSDEAEKRYPGIKVNGFTW